MIWYELIVQVDMTYADCHCNYATRKHFYNYQVNIGRKSTFIFVVIHYEYNRYLL